MLLSVYLGRSYLSAVLFELNPFSVKAKSFINIPYEADAFFAIHSIQQVNQLLIDTLKISDEDFAAATKILIKAENVDTPVQGWQISNTIQQIMDSVAGRIFLLDPASLEKHFTKNKELLNKFANFTYYHKQIPADMMMQASTVEVKNYWKTYQNPKASLKEVIVSTFDFDANLSETIENTLVKEISDACDQNKIIEITYDYGFYLIPIIAALIDQKIDPRTFFTENPIHIDTKVIVIPGMENDLEFANDKNEIITEIEDKEGIKFIQIDEKDTIIIKSKNPKRKVHLELLGCKKGLYVDARTKKAEK